MNLKLKLALILNRSCSREQGAILPVMIGLGLIMTLAGTTMIIRSSDEQKTAIAQNQTTQALAAAEAGATRLQGYLNQNRTILAYNMSDWKNSSTMDTAVANTFSVSDSCSGTGSVTGTEIANYINNVSKNWQTLSGNSQYKLVNYTYTSNSSNPNETPGTGTLTVAGKKGDAVSQITVDVPVQNNSGTIDFPFPGMWVTSDSGAKTTYADILAHCSASTVSITPEPGYEVKRTTVSMPTPPAIPTTNIYDLGAIDSDTTLPRPTDITNSTNYDSATQTYQYKASSITDDLTFTPGYKVTVYLNGNISLTGGQKAIKHQCGSTPGCSPTDARILGYASNGSLDLKGNAAVCDVFFWAPTYTLTVSGGGQAQGCQGGNANPGNPNNNGIYWLKQWGSTSNTNKGGGQGNHIALYQTTADWDDILAWADIETQIQLPPTPSSASSWKREAAN